ncbi:MAG TPA: SIMPL domain-containing protein, partial [Candidatus Binatus sp.]|nr:SIMPL domain-containing protein [Candidatus Binatus sp.]
MKKLLIFTAAIVIFTGPLYAQPRSERPRSPSITVNGDATTSVEPDQAQIDIGVVTQARSAPDASKDN